VVSGVYYGRLVARLEERLSDASGVRERPLEGQEIESRDARPGVNIFDAYSEPNGRVLPGFHERASQEGRDCLITYRLDKAGEARFEEPSGLLSRRAEHAFSGMRFASAGQESVAPVADSRSTNPGRDPLSNLWTRGRPRRVGRAHEHDA